MKTYIVQYRVDLSRWQSFGKVKAKSPASAIIRAAKHLTDIAGVLEISACET